MTFSIFNFYRRRQNVVPFKSARPRLVEEAPHPNPATARIFEATHVHVRTGRHYMLTSAGERLEVTGDDAYPLAEYEDSEGNQFAQRLDRFSDGRFMELPL